MATKKQQKRRRKMRVHGTYLREGPAQPSRAPREGRSARRPSRTQGRSGRGSRWVRVPPEATFQRSLKRTATLVFPFLLLIWWFLGKSQDHSVTTFVTTVIAPSLLFVPFDYYATGFMNRMLKRRTGQ